MLCQNIEVLKNRSDRLHLTLGNNYVLAGRIMLIRVIIDPRKITLSRGGIILHDSVFSIFKSRFEVYSFLE